MNLLLNKFLTLSKMLFDFFNTFFPVAFSKAYYSSKAFFLSSASYSFYSFLYSIASSEASPKLSIKIAKNS